MSKKPQVHKRIVLLFMKEVFDAYLHERFTLAQAIETLGLGRSNFFRYMKMYRQHPEGFSLKYVRKTATNKLTAAQDEIIARMIREEKELVKHPGYEVKRINFEALSVELKKQHEIAVPAETIRQKAIKWNLYLPRQRNAKIYRQLETTKIGRLFQHDTCLHQWSPYLAPFYLILTVDDHSRRILCARFFEKESSMNHILCVRDTLIEFGLPLAYYTDRHSIFTYNEKESYRYRFQTKTEDAQVQWQRVMKLLEIQSILANSPQAKGKVESKFKYLQGRVVRRCAKEQAKTVEHAQRILDEEVSYYNEHKKHHVTDETPKERWDKAIKEGRSVLRSCLGSHKSIFCLQYSKKLDAYGRTTLKGTEIQVKKAPLKNVTIHYIEENGEVEIRVWCDGELLKVIRS